MLPLRDFAAYLEKNQPDSSTDGPKLLLDYLHTYFANQDIPLSKRFFADPLQEGQCAVLLDGVDEVAELSLRHRVARIIERFTTAYPDNRYVVTSRVVGYTGSARLGQGYDVTTVRDFTWDDIERFVTYWNRAVEAALAGGDTPYAQREAHKQAGGLLKAIQGNERVRELAVNPLMLTVIALVQRYRAQLPERRTELYEEAVEVLLARWDEAKGLPDKALLGKGVIEGYELDAGDRRSLLEAVALWMMEQHAREIETDELRRQLGQRFFQMTSDRRQAGKAVDGFLRLINERSGLLAERGQGVYAFSHLTFQEHLAARAMSDKADYIDYTMARLGDSWWREVILLEAGYLSTQGKQRVTALIQAIMDCRQEPELYHNLVLAAESLRDVGPARVGGDLWGEVQRRLRREFERPLSETQAEADLADLIRRRAAAAEALAKIESGVAGTQPAYWRLPYGEPAWVEIPAGEFWMGTREEDIPALMKRYGGERKYYEWEVPQHKVLLPAYAIARVPVTNAQYLLFVQATGHEPPRHWDGGRPPKGKESHPVVYVTWRDAIAYCEWLSQVTGKPIRLPTEAEWEKAARGTQDRHQCPWGDAFEESYCNNAALGLEDTTPVGIFPEGASPFGVLVDMAGNVWEWCSSKWGTDYEKPDFGYPYRPDDGREDLKGTDLRILRGGSWRGNAFSCRCGYRYRFDPRYRLDYWGFRCARTSL